MNQWQRKKLRDVIDRMVSLALSQSHIETDENGCSTLITDGQNTTQMLLLQQEYYGMIRRKTSLKGQASSKGKSKKDKKKV